MSDNDRTSPGEIETGIAGRACEACHKKKTKCDMQQPVCGLCRRTGKKCHFPSTRKRPSRQEPSVRAKLQKVNGNLDRLVELLEKNPGIEPESLKGILADKLETKDVTTNTDSSPGRKDNPTVANLARSSVKDEEDVFSHTLTTVTPAIKIRTMSYELATHLVDVFFYNIHPWLSIFHQPKFMRWMRTRLVQGPDAFTALTMSERTLFNAMFALSARWSNHALLANLQPRERGEKFMKTTEFWFKKVREIEEFDLTFLKGAILLAYYHYASGCSKRGWYITHMCVRGAYELGLHQIDDTNDSDSNETEWVEKESLRRLFWAVYELDQFGSIIKRKPFGIDYRHVDVKMPVSNDAWLSGNKVESAKFIHGGECWKTLIGSQNQDERAWTLLAKTLVGHVFDLMLFKDGITNEQISICENNISCFKMAMPESLQLTSPTWSSADMPIARKNWITATNLYLACASFILTRIPVLNQLPSPAEETQSKVMAIYMNRVSELNEILKRWPREALQFAHPLSICTILTYDESLVKLLPPTTPVIAYRDLSGLILEKIAQRWQLGAVLLRVRDLANDYQNSDQETRADLVRQYPVFFDREIRKHRKTIVEEANRVWTPSATSPSTSTTTRRSIDHSHSPEHIVQQQQLPGQSQSQSQSQLVSQAFWQPAIQPTTQPPQISQSPQQQSQLQLQLDQSQSELQLEQPQLQQQLQQSMSPTNYSNPNPATMVYDQPNDINTTPNYQDWNSFANVTQSPEDIDSLFSGFMQEPWWQDFGGVNFVV